MKKYLPLILFLLGILLVAAVFVFLRGRNNLSDEIVDEEAALLDVPLNERPIASLVPTDDGHYLVLKVDKLMIDEAATLDYELLYLNKEGVTQGVPGTVKLNGRESFESELLLGSESSGKFRYDEGVEEGSLTLRFRNDKGKLLAKFSTDFRLLNGVSEIVSKDSNFKADLNGDYTGYIVIMKSFGLPSDPGNEVKQGPYGLFSSGNETLTGTVTIMDAEALRHITDSQWSDENENNSLYTETGVYVGI